MIYPFILRRTKEQVAPELPPRTERIIYTDMEPAQRKLYQQTREYYRSLLMGMLAESGDINDIRFKILEGLLRMRQVCIHPGWLNQPIAGLRPNSRFCWRHWKPSNRKATKPWFFHNSSRLSACCARRWTRAG